MKPFVFRLAGVLAVWQRREDAALTNLQKQMAETAAAQRRIVDAERRLQQAHADARPQPGSHPGSEDPTWHRNWITHLGTRLAAAREEAVKCAAVEASARAAWQRASRDRRVIERLRDRAQARHATDTRRDEWRQMDALAGMAAGRRDTGTW